MTPAPGAVAVFKRNQASAGLRAIMREYHCDAWEPAADGGAYIEWLAGSWNPRYQRRHVTREEIAERAQLLSEAR